MSRKKQIEKQEIDYSQYKKVEAPTYYSWYMHKDMEAELPERMAKFNHCIEKTLREKELRGEC